MNEQDLPWPPKRPPENLAIKKAWNLLHDETIKYLKRNIPNKNSKTRTLLKKLSPNDLRLRIMTEEEQGEMDLDEKEDHCPFFGDTDEERSYEVEDSKNQGDLATTGIELYQADTRFCLSLSLEYLESNLINTRIPIWENGYRRILMHPHAAAYIVSTLKNHHRRTIADALLFQFLRDQGEQLADEEWDDGGVAPVWRNGENDPVRDILIICADLERLYREIVENPQ